MTSVLYVAFFLSGLSGLVYETIWSRYLALLVGHSAYAQVIVLVIFLGGLSAGAFLAGQVSERLRRPLLWYAAAEVMVGVLGLLFHDLFTAATTFSYETLVPALSGGGAVTAARWSLAALLILPQSVLLGTTFPLMSAAVLRRLPTEPGRVLAVLYFTNSLGAALGALVSGFWLIALAGLPGTLATAAGLNLLVALMAYGVERGGEEPVVEAAGASPVVAQPAEEADAAGHLPSRRTLWRWLLGVSFGTAVASFVYEIVWIRMLSLVLGSATHSFELMLSAFILGLALGALWIRRRADHLEDPLRMLAEIQWVMGFTALATLPVYILSFDLVGGLFDVLQRSEAGYVVFNAARYGVALAVMLPSTFCAGMTLPLITRTLVVSGEGERAVGWVYGINTLGSIVGVAAAALLLLPLLGLKWLLVLGAAVDMGLGVAILFLRPGSDRPVRRLAWGAVVATPVVAVGLGVAATLDRSVLMSGVYRTGHVPPPGAREILYYEDGRTASVGVVRQGDVVWISTNGKADASLRTLFLEDGPLGDPGDDDGGERAGGAGDLVFRGDEATQVFLALVPLAHNPDARRAAVVGQGSGVTSHVLLGSPEIEHVTTIDIEPRMIEGSRHFLPANRRVFEDPRSSLRIADARTALGFGDERYDLVVSEPSNPWVSGTASLFTSEFYARVRERLAPGGVFAQWVQAYEISDELILTILAALHPNFPSYQVFRVMGDLIIVAGTGERLPRPDWSVVEAGGIARDLDGVRPLAPAFMEATRIATREGLAPLVERWAPNSDFFPILDLEADRARFLDRAAVGFRAVGRGSLDASTAVLPPVRGPAGRWAPTGGARMEGLALSRRLVDALETGEADLSAGDRALAAALHRTRRLLRLLELGEPPADWREWVADVMEVLDALQGPRGAYEPIYGRLHRFMAEAGAPPEAFAAVRFAHGAASRSWPELAAAAEVLAGAAVAGENWIPPDALRDGGTLARLATGDVAGARRLFDALAPHATRDPRDLRTRLLVARLVEAGARADRPDPR